jgi:predicted SnoaL-like aldol condensation-catalyzing enzyme
MAGATMRCQIRGGGAQHLGRDRLRRLGSRAEERTVTNSGALGAHARQVMIDIFRKKDVTAVDRNFSKSLIQHDPNLAGDIDGMTSFAADVASSPAAGITICRTLVDGDSVLLHSRYEGLENASGPLLAMDLFRFEDDKIVEHWGGQQPESPDRNLSGHTQVDGPTAVEDRDQTEANRALIEHWEVLSPIPPRDQ